MYDNSANSSRNFEKHLSSKSECAKAIRITEQLYQWPHMKKTGLSGQLWVVCDWHLVYALKGNVDAPFQHQCGP
jgi:hypothetical protein